MRLLATIVLSILLLGGTWLFIEFDSRAKPKPSNVTHADALAKTTIEIVRNFDCAGNADFKEDAIRVTLVEDIAFSSQAEKLAATEPVNFPLKGVKQGKNSITVFGNIAPADDFGDAGPTLNTMLVKVMYDSKEIAREVFASDDDFDSTIGGEVSFFIQPVAADDDHAH